MTPDPRPADPRRAPEHDLPTGQSVAALGALFFATLGVSTWASTVHGGMAFMLGAAWCLVLLRALRWLEGRTG